MSKGVRKKSMQPHLALIHANPAASAEIVELHYVQDDKPGITRRAGKSAFTFHGPDGKKITDKATLERIRLLGIPPAYTDVWICPDPVGHLQATGRAENGKKQYIYHPRWREVRNLTKYSHMITFGELLPSIRSQVATDLQLPGLPRRKVIAAVVRLLECTLIRIGNDRYAKENDSYGLTTLTKDHVDIHGNKIRFEFRGKGGKDWSLDIQDARIAKIVKKCESLPGFELFQYIDSEGNVQDVGSSDVNAYLKEITEEEITAKCFRTWAGTVAAYKLLKECNLATDCSKTLIKQNVTQAVKAVAEQLGNTAAVCRKNYIHPDILESYMDGSIHVEINCPPREGLHSDEIATLELLKKKFEKIRL